MRFDKRFPLTLSAALICLVPLLYGAPAHAGSHGYLIDSAGNPVRSPFGECWHTFVWRKGFRFADCEPAPVVEAPSCRLTPRRPPP
jgi:hypothetical protein